MNSNVVTILQNLIQIPSESGNEAEIQKYIFNYLTNLGYNPLFVQENIVLVIPGKDRNKAVIFNAHVDTVSAGNESLWTSSPYDERIDDGRIYGLGSSDEKACAATLLAMAETYLIQVPACDVILTFVVNEETDGSGTAQFVEYYNANLRAQYTTVAGIFGEPTDAEKIYIAHRGGITIHITTYGDSGHASQPEKIKTHAVKQMLEVSNRMEELAKELARDFEHPVLGVPTIACMTTINAGKSTNKFPDSCNATFDLRNTPGLTREIIDERTHRVLEGINCKIEMNELRLACGYTEPEDPIVKTVTKIVGKPALISKFSTDMLFFTVAGIPGLIYGPGTEHCIHQPNEFCEIDNLERCLGEYLRIVEEY